MLHEEKKPIRRRVERDGKCINGTGIGFVSKVRILLREADNLVDDEWHAQHGSGISSMTET